MANKTIPFIIDADRSQSVWCFETYDNYIFAGTGPEGVILISDTRDFWQKYYTLDDVNVSALYAYNGFLYAGTSSQGKVYVFDLSDDSLKSVNGLGNAVSGFASLEGVIYAMSGENVYVYDKVGLKWDFLYKANADINCVYVGISKFYLGLSSENVISFDGSNWVMENNGVDNFSSFRRSSKEPFSHVTYGSITRNTIIDSDNIDEESVFDIFPKDYVRGISSLTQDGSTVIFGASNYGRIFRFDDNNFDMMFQTEGDSVYSLLTVDSGITLASIGNRVFLTRCYDEAEDSEVTTTTTTTSGDTSTSSNFTLSSPSSGDAFEIGSTVNIQWTSQRGVNEGVKIELYKADELDRVINAKTSNDGEYEWFIPSNIEAGNDYKIKISWVTTGAVSSEDTDMSDSFTLTFLLVTTTTTTETSTISLPQNCQGIPILVLDANDYVTCMKEDDKAGHVLFGTFSGKIFSCSLVAVNGYLSSGRSVYGEAVDGFGHVSKTTSTEVLYGLYKKVAEISVDKAITRWKFVENGVPLSNERISGVFTSPILYVREDLGFWKDFSWTEDKPDNTAITICIRSADTTAELALKDYDYCFDSTGKTVPYVESIDPLLINGKYLQFKITMETDAIGVTPVVLSTGISFSTKQTLYFFTTKFSLETDSNARTGLITANITEPENTEITFGISDENSDDWNDYKVVDLNRFFTLDNYESLKVGIKFVSYDTNIPEVAEFALMIGADEDTIIEA